ncbi:MULTISPECIES: hypothetical protein [Streptomyces]|uniref:Uncharacterized protein n=1 Tax=Streptomyces morookaense TaxID=1970 RepID=A0A7Y7E8L9_STRMO|nr:MULTISPECIES: hypothetical protein [Streptomyces]MCC2279675.1 hypothetical protein [Streptomyces sp. ET3-23]NVK79574.1 hypothetical protein [Streptomyces morookaense]GHF48092.1 hypothetical protein GCM10010359_57920 [Streptomyces morookaense]
MPAFDVNAARAQRLEAHGRSWSFSLDGDTFELPTEIGHRTARALRELDDNDVDGLLGLLLGKEQFARFVEHDVTMQDIAAILEAYGKETGLGLGED